MKELSYKQCVELARKIVAAGQPGSLRFVPGVEVLQGTPEYEALEAKIQETYTATINAVIAEVTQ